MGSSLCRGHGPSRSSRWRILSRLKSGWEMPMEPTHFTTCPNELSQFQVRGQAFQRLQNAEHSVPILRVQIAPLEGFKQTPCRWDLAIVLLGAARPGN